MITLDTHGLLGPASDGSVLSISSYGKRREVAFPDPVLLPTVGPKFLTSSVVG